MLWVRVPPGVQYIIITRCDTPPIHLLKQHGNCGSPNVAEVIMLKKLVTGSPVDEVQIRVSVETTPVRASSLRDRVEFYFKKILCHRPVSHRG